MEGGLYVNENGDKLRGVIIFNVPVGDPEYVEAMLRNKAQEVVGMARKYIVDLEKEYPKELWTLLQYSLQHKITYWLRTCTPEETEEMAELVDVAILEVCHAATGIRFDVEPVAKDKLRLPARLKGGGIKSMADMRRHAFLGAILDILPRCIDIRGPNGEEMEGIYKSILTNSIGRGAYDQNGHMNTGFLHATCMDPYPMEMQCAWRHARQNASHNICLTLLSSADEWGRLGPLAKETPAEVRSRGAAERKRKEGTEDGDSQRWDGIWERRRQGGQGRARYGRGCGKAGSSCYQSRMERGNNGGNCISGSRGSDG